MQTSTGVVDRSAQRHVAPFHRVSAARNNSENITGDITGEVRTRRKGTKRSAPFIDPVGDVGRRIDRARAVEGGEPHTDCVHFARVAANTRLSVRLNKVPFMRTKRDAGAIADASCHGPHTSSAHSSRTGRGQAARRRQGLNRSVRVQKELSAAVGAAASAGERSVRVDVDLGQVQQEIGERPPGKEHDLTENTSKAATVGLAARS